MACIIIPAHNEENVIGRCLNSLLNGAKSGTFEIIVVCNGCSDRTAEIVASFGELITLIETSVASKTNALNLGDHAAATFPRFYQDADVVITPDAVKDVADLLERGSFLAASPKMKMNYGRSSWAVRSYYDIWQKLPYVREGMIGTGVYGLSREGRARFDKFPDIIADDGYVRALFTSAERGCVTTAASVVRAPLNIKNLIKIKTRSRMGQYQLRDKFPELKRNEKKNYIDALADLIGDIKLWPKILVYLYVNLSTRLRAKKYIKINQTVSWGRDESSRDIF